MLVALEADTVIKLLSGKKIAQSCQRTPWEARQRSGAYARKENKSDQAGKEGENRHSHPCPQDPADSSNHSWPRTGKEYLTHRIPAHVAIPAAPQGDRVSGQIAGHTV